MTRSATVALLALVASLGPSCASVTSKRGARIAIGTGAAIVGTGLLLFLAPSLDGDDDAPACDDGDPAGKCVGGVIGGIFTGIGESAGDAAARILGIALMATGGFVTLVGSLGYRSATMGSREPALDLSRTTPDTDACSDWYRALSGETDPARRAALHAVRPPQCARPTSR